MPPCPNFIVEKLTQALNDRKQCFGNSRILVLGVAYKPDVDDERESPAYAIMGLVEKAGANVDYYDPHTQYSSFPTIRMLIMKRLSVMPA